MDDQQKYELCKAADEEIRYITSTWLCSAVAKETGEIVATKGHDIQTQLALTITAPFIKGAFIKMSKTYEGIQVLQLDSGGSRSLYDGYSISQRAEFLYRLMMIMGDSNHRWLTCDADRQAHLVVCDANFQLEQIFVLSI